MKVELIYDADCPNVAAARSALMEAFMGTGLSARWQEWERSADATPAYAKSYGSPTILVEGQDVAGLEREPGSQSCRLYLDDNGALARAPAAGAISAALLAAEGTTRGRFHSVLASLPAIGTALLPKLTCPLCFPAYSAVLGAAGLGFVDYTPYLLPATLVFLAFALIALGANARRTRKPLPLALGLISATTVLFGKFVAGYPWVTNVGIGLLVVAISVATWKRSVRRVACPSCLPDQSKTPAR